MKRVLKIFTAWGLAAVALTSCRQDVAFFPSVYRSDMFVQEYTDSRYDFLWVLDNSGSMGPRRQIISDNMQTFLKTLNSRKAIDFQMAVTSGDYMFQQGKLIQNGSGLSVVKSATSANPASDFGTLIAAIADSPTSFWQQGLESAYQAVTQYGTQFSRTGVPLLVIFVSDADDYSCQSNCWGVEPVHNPDTRIYPTDRYAQFFANVKASENTDTYLFPIVPLDSTTCAVETAGYRYMQVQKYVGGVGTSGSVCPQSIQASYNAIAQVIADRGTVFKLSAKATGQGIQVYVNQVLIAGDGTNYIYDPTLNAIVFTGYAPTSGSTILISYSQVTN